MARPAEKNLTEVELEIMQVIWSDGDSSVREVSARINKKRKVAYTSVMTMLKVMEQKGYVKKRKRGKANIYTANITEAQARSSAVKNLLTKFFGGSKSAFGLHLVGEENVDLDELIRLRDQLREKDE